MKRILVPTDFSEAAFNALSFAIELSKKTSCEIDVVHAYYMPTGTTTVMVDISDVLQKNALEDIGILKNRIHSRYPDARVNYYTEYGSVVDVLDKYVRNNSHDMVIMGTTGATGIEKILGSNTTAVVRELKIPVLAIPAGHVFSGLDSLVYCTDFKYNLTDPSLKVLTSITSSFNSSIKVVHVQEEGEEISDIDKENFRNLSQKILPGESFTFQFINNTGVAEGLAEVVERDNPDMIILIKHEYGFFEGLFHNSVSKSVLHSSRIPVLILKDKE